MYTDTSQEASPEEEDDTKQKEQGVSHMRGAYRVPMSPKQGVMFIKEGEG